MRYRVLRRVLLALLAALTVVTAIPAAASASISPSLTLNPASLSAGAMAPLGFDLIFSPSSGDYPSIVNLTLPPGLVLDLGNGACLASATPEPGCELGTGTATPPGGVFGAVSLWLVKAPAAADVAGVALENEAGTVDGSGSITLRTNPTVGFDVSLALPPNLSAITFEFSTVRAPTTCPATPATIGISATSAQDSTPKTASTALPVTGCSSLAYTPTVASTVVQDNDGAGAVFTASVTGVDTDSATQALEIDLPASILPNASAALSCLLGKPCTIGTASATSPLLPSSALSDGTVQLGGSIVAPSLSLTFPAPYPIALTGAIKISTEALTFGGIPDLPISSLSIVVGGGSSKQLFTTNCAAASLTTKLTPWDGAAAQTLSTPITYGGTCPATPTTPASPSPSTSPANPTVSGGSLSGVVRRAAKLAFTVKQGQGAKPIKVIALGLPRGLSFARAKANLAKGIVVRGAHNRLAKLTTSVKHGVLSIDLGSAVASAKVTVSSPAITVAGRLAAGVKHALKKKLVSALKFTLRLTDTGGHATPIAVRLKPKS